MKKTNKTFRNSLFFLLGVFAYSLLFWISHQNHALVFGVILMGLACYLIDLLSVHSRLVQPKDVIYFCIGIFFDAFSGGFPFNMFQPF